MQDRLSSLREAVVALDLEGILITQQENRRYLSGFTGSAGVLIVTEQDAMLATDFRYYEQVKQQAPAWQLVEVKGPMHKALAETIPGMDLHRVGFESQHVSVHTFEQWREAMPSVEWVLTRDVVEKLRVVKDEAEIASIRRAVEIADEAMAYIMDWIRPGLTEREVAWELEVYMRTHGAEKLSFETIVASGPNGAMAHAVTTDRQIQAGDPVVIDMGAVYAGYCSDLTRSFCVDASQIDERYRIVWDTVLEAQLAAEAAIEAGMTGVEADAVAREIIDGAGHKGRFGHGLGHGVGLAIHEDPRASRTSTDTLQAGSVLTVEPGIYLPGWGGVRIEDMVVIEENGCEVLTGVAKQPVVGGG